MNILIVCLGNICRSPIAEGIFKKKVNTNLHIIDSAATSDWNVGDPPDIRSIDIASKHDIDISYIRSRKIKLIDFEFYDKLLVMDKKNLNDLNLMTNNKFINKISLILNEAYGIDDEVTDPYYGDKIDFYNTFNILYKSISTIVYKLKLY